MILIKICCPLLIVSFIFACGAPQVTRKPAIIRGIELRMQEVAKDGEFDIYPDDKFRKIDANSTLRLTFKTPPKPEEVQSSPEWQNLTNVLNLIKETAEEYRTLSEKAKALLKPGARHDPEFTAQVDKVMEQVPQILIALVSEKDGKAIIPSEEFDDLFRQHKDDLYSWFAEIINEERNQLHEKAAEFGKNAEEFEIVLRAYLQPKGGGRQPLHIPGYDNLPQGNFRPLNPKGLLPSPQETQRLIVELESARKVSASINEIRKNGKLIQKNLKQIGSELRENLLKLVNEIQDELLNKLPSGWQSIFEPNFLEQLDKLATTESLQISKALNQIGKDLDAFKEIVTRARDMRRTFQSGFSPAQITGATLSKITDLAKKIKNTLTGIGQWGQHLQNIAEATPGVLAAELDQTAKNTLQKVKDRLSATLKNAQERFKEALPKTYGALSVLKFSRDSKGILEIGADAPPYIPHPLGDLRPAELDLRYSGIVVGDHISFTVDLRRTSEEESGIQKPPSVTYNAEATLAGWHRLFDSNVIFSRTLKGQDGFRSNIAVSMEMHHFNRNNPGSFFNKLDPGLGFHAAFLDQDDTENIEMGGGVNLSILDGLVRTGIGYNFSSRKNSEYWFVGFGLFNLLGQIKDLGQ